MRLNMFSTQEENTFKEILNQTKEKLSLAFHQYITFTHCSEDLSAHISMSDIDIQSPSKFPILNEANYKSTVEEINRDCNERLCFASESLSLAKKNEVFDKEILETMYEYDSGYLSEKKNDRIIKHHPFYSPETLKRIQHDDDALTQRHQKFLSERSKIEDLFEQKKAQFFSDLRTQFNIPSGGIKPLTNAGLLFPAMSLALKNQNLGLRSAEELRADAINYIKKNPVIFLRAYKDSGELNAYLNRMSRSETKEDAFMMHALARCLNVHIKIFNTTDELNNETVKVTHLWSNDKKEIEASIDLILIGDDFYYLAGQEKPQNTQKLRYFESHKIQTQTADQSVASYKTPTFFFNKPIKTLNHKADEWLPKLTPNR